MRKAKPLKPLAKEQAPNPQTPTIPTSPPSKWDQGAQTPPTDVFFRPEESKVLGFPQQREFEA